MLKFHVVKYCEFLSRGLTKNWGLSSFWCVICFLKFRDGRPLTDDEISGMLIGLLLAGQHTSSTTSTWLGFFLAREKSIQEQCYEEQKNVCGEDLPPLTYDQVCRPVTPFQFTNIAFKCVCGIRENLH